MTTTVKQTYTPTLNTSITMRDGLIASVTTWRDGVSNSTDRVESATPARASRVRNAMVTVSPPIEPVVTVKSLIDAVNDSDGGNDYDYGISVPAMAALLDDYDSKWFERIDLSTLSMMDASHCILGQLFGSWQTGTRTLAQTYPGLDNDSVENATAGGTLRWATEVENRRA